MMLLCQESMHLPPFAESDHDDNGYKSLCLRQNQPSLLLSLVHGE